MRMALAATLLLLAAGTSEAQWATYENGRYGYRLNIPPGVDNPVVSDNGDGVRFETEAGYLSVYGVMLMEGTFAEEARGRRDWAAGEGWHLSYETIEPHAATFDMSKNGVIRYVHGIEICDGAAAFFEYDYRVEEVKILRPIFRHMSESLEATGACADDPPSRPYPTD